jgi:hypothetical protein
VKIINELEVKIVFKVSLWDAFKMRLSGKFVDKYFEELTAKLKAQHGFARGDVVKNNAGGEKVIVRDNSNGIVLSEPEIKDVRAKVEQAFSRACGRKF